MKLVIDASVLVEISLAEEGLGLLYGHELSAPALLRSESVSVLHELLWRREISADLAGIALGRVLGAPVRLDRSKALARNAWKVAEDLGWAKSYDAEYVALARSMDCPLLTMDFRLHRGASRLVKVMGPADLKAH